MWSVILASILTPVSICLIYEIIVLILQKKQKLIRLFDILSMFIRLENDYKYISFMFLNMHAFEAIRIMMNWFHANNTCSKNGWNLFSITNSDISEKFSVNV